MSLITVWHDIQDNIKEKVGKISYETWFSAIHVLEKDLQTLVVEAPDEFFKNWIVEHYQACIVESLKQKSGREVNVEFSVNANILKKETQNRLSSFEKGFDKNHHAGSNLNSRFTFDNFVIGPSNRFACAAGIAVAESPAKAYNPLFIYGPVGLGKTHLIQAITHKLRELHPHLKHCYMSSEQFTNELIDAIRNRSTSQFRKKYREIDVLLIDDIQFIAGKESTQEEFFHTFNSLHDNHKQIIITSDRPPKEISRLEERLSSRFAWGLITDIQSPNFETRVAILRKKIETESVPIPEEVTFFIAEQINTNIRELEGALIRVVAYSLLEECPVTLNTTKMVLKDVVTAASKIISVDTIQKSVCDLFNVPMMELRTRKRHKNIVAARQVAMYLTRQLTPMSLPEIGYAFGGKDHTTVMHSCRKIEKEIAENIQLKNTILQLTTSLQK